MKYGFIGCGNMGGAIAKAVSQSTKDILLSDLPAKAQALAQELGCKHGDNGAVITLCDRVFLGVKPQMMQAMLEELRPMLAQKKPLLITMAAGLEIKKIQEFAGTPLPIIRIMPNTSVSVGKGMILYCCNELVDEATLQDFVQDMQYAGRLDAIEEKLIDAASALSGCGPAYMYMFIEALADGAVACGVPRAKAIEYAAATMAGAAEMVLQTGLHPGQLKDNVCSPGGSTIAGVKALEDGAFRSTVMNCIQAATKRNSELGK